MRRNAPRVHLQTLHQHHCPANHLQLLVLCCPPDPCPPGPLAPRAPCGLGDACSLGDFSLSQASGAAIGAAAVGAAAVVRSELGTEPGAGEEDENDSLNKEALYGEQHGQEGMNSEAGDLSEGDGPKSDQEPCEGSADGHCGNIQDCREESAKQHREEGESCDNGEHGEMCGREIGTGGGERDEHWMEHGDTDRIDQGLSQNDAGLSQRHEDGKNDKDEGDHGKVGRGGLKCLTVCLFAGQC